MCESVCVCLTCKPKASSVCGLSKVQNYVTLTAAASKQQQHQQQKLLQQTVLHFECCALLLVFKPSGTRLLQQPTTTTSVHTHNKFNFNERSLALAQRLSLSH